MNAIRKTTMNTQSALDIAIIGAGISVGIVALKQTYES
jgi:hypothetical protein